MVKTIMTRFEKIDKWLNEGSSVLIAGKNVERADPQNGEYFTLPELQSYVGGFIETIYIDDEKMFVVNEEGNLLGLYPNALATEYLGSSIDIVGNVLICLSRHMN